jgi:hypothetical protein
MMPAGWTRLVLENFEFPYENVYPQMLDAGNLNARFDAIVFVDGALSLGGGGRGGGGGGGGGGGRGGGAAVPPEFAAMQGAVTAERTLPQLRAFLENGGRILTIGGSTSLASALGLPFSNHLVENGQGLPDEKFYVPGSLLRVAVDTTAAIAAGMPAHADVMFDNSPVFRLGADAAARGVRVIARFDSATPLRSGWAWGQHYLRDGVAMAEATVGRGVLYAFGPEILFRSQPHGTFKFLFNGLYGAR